MDTLGAVVKLGELNSDAIDLGQSCVNPLYVDESGGDAAPKVVLSMEAPDALLESVPAAALDAPKKRATVSLSDCLACSGCVTSAETVLIQAQSLERFKELERPLKVAISEASLGSLGATLGRSDLGAFLEDLVVHCRSLEIELVDIPAQPSLRAVYDEFVGLRDAAQRGGTPQHSWKLPRTSIAIDAETTKYFTDEYGSREDCVVANSDDITERALPLLTSECPGWVCYVEKTHPQAIPYLSTTQTPMQSLDASTRVSVQPCADKKLESARLDAGWGELVLTTKEFLEFLGGDEFNLGDSARAGAPRITAASGPSLGYGDYIFRRYCLEKYSLHLHSTIQKKRIAKDRYLAELEIDGEIVLSFEWCYGFKNVQKVIRLLKKNKLRRDFVEVMACPSGCAGGEGQTASASEVLQVLTTGVEIREDNSEARAASTAFHAVPKLAADLVSRW